MDISRDKVDHSLVLFLAGNRVSLGYNMHEYKDFLKMKDHELDSCHNFIQWAFPTDQQSMFRHDAPQMNIETLDAIRRLREFVEPNVVGMAKHMLSFYARNNTWQQVGDHNLLRISRIIRSLNLIISPTKAEWFYYTIRGITLRDAKQDWVPEQALRIWQSHCHPGLYHLVK
jgi:hypothetical protein